MKSNLTIFAFAVLILCETTFAAKFEDFVKTFPKCKESISEFHCSVSVEKDLAPTSHLASTTPYIYQKPLKNESDFKISNADATNIWMMTRHGIRVPTTSELEKTHISVMPAFRDEVLKNHEAGRGKLVQSDLDKLKEWKLLDGVSMENEGALLPDGENELASFAHTCHSMFPKIFTKTYDSKNFHFGYTGKARTVSSSKAFLNELFGSKAADSIVVAKDTDVLLKWEDDPEFLAHWDTVSKNVSPDSELKKFERTTEYKKMIKDFEALLGFNRSLTVTEVDTIYEMCTFDQSWHLRKPSIWCSLITLDQLRLFEYKKDIYYYYALAYGTKVNKRMGCDAVQNLITQLDSSQKATVFFAHQSTLKVFLTTIGAFEDKQPLKADNYKKMGNRLWKVGVISPFAANFAAVKYKKDKVRFFQNERILKLSWCDKDGMCTLMDVKEKLAAENCRPKQTTPTKKSKSGKSDKKK